MAFLSKKLFLGLSPSRGVSLSVREMGSLRSAILGCSVLLLLGACLPGAAEKCPEGDSVRVYGQWHQISGPGAAADPEQRSVEFRQLIVDLGNGICMIERDSRGQANLVFAGTFRMVTSERKLEVTVESGQGFGQILRYSFQGTCARPELVLTESASQAYRFEPTVNDRTQVPAGTCDAVVDSEGGDDQAPVQ